MEGHQLYTMFVREVRAARMHPAEVTGPEHYQALSPRAKAVWQRLAQDFAAQQPRERNTLNLRTGRYTP